MEKTSSMLPLSDCHLKKNEMIINRLHIFLHGIALCSLFYYRFITLAQIIQERDTTLFLPYVLVVLSEITLSFLWILGQPSYWRPVKRTVYPERLPEDEKLPGIDVFICTSDPSKEPNVGVMNTLISALALDYPPDKLCVYISDDGGSFVTLRSVQEAWKFAKLWIPFCRKYKLKNRCPEAYFSSIKESENCSDKIEIERTYHEFKNRLVNMAMDARTSISRDHPPLIEVMDDANDNDKYSKDKEMPLLVYVSREKRPGHPHHFKAGALNVLLRVSAMISNAPFVLVLDCDMYCNDSSSARQAMCFHLDSILSPKLGFVQFPQVFHTISPTDIYDGQLRYIWKKWEGLDGIKGPVLSGTGFYVKRKALYGAYEFRNEKDLIQLQKLFGSSNEFIKTIYRNYKSNNTRLPDISLQKEMSLVASSTYDNGTKWGKQVGFRYFCVVEDVFTGMNLHCEGWKSVYIEPSRPCFLGSSPVSLNVMMIQHTRWNFGFLQIALSKFSPLIYGPWKMSILQSMCYADLCYSPLYFVPYYCLAIVPQLCIISGIPLYPQVSSPYFLVFLFVFVSSQFKHMLEIFWSRKFPIIHIWLVEQRMWMIKALASYPYAALDAIMEKFGLRQASFLPTDKVVDDEQDKRYQMGTYDFQASAMFMVPLCSLYILNIASFLNGFFKILLKEKGNEMFMQALVPLFGMIVNFPLLDGMVLRKDRARVSTYVTINSIVISIVVLYFASLVNY